MPRAAIICWDARQGVSVLSAGPNKFYLTHTGDQKQDAEEYTKLVRFLQAISTNLPPLEPLGDRKVPDGGLPEVTEEDIRCAQRMTHPMPARGSGSKRRGRPTQTQLLNIIDDL